RRWEVPEASSLNQRCVCAAHVHSNDLRLAGQDQDILPHGPLFDLSVEPLCNRVLHRFERQRPAGNAPVYRDDVKAMARPAKLAQNSIRAQPEQRPLEFWHGIAAANLTEVAALLPGGAIG